MSGDLLPEEIVVVDQSTDDRTRTTVRKVKNDGVRVVYLQHAGTGLASSQNLAFANATCSVVAVTDDDCRPTPEWIANIKKTFASADGIDVLTGRILPLGPERPGCFPVASRAGTLRVEFRGKSLPWEIGSGNNFAARREWLTRVGGNDERLGPGAPGRGAADMDLFYRLARAGAHIRFEPASLVYHERASGAARMARRLPYGYGMGAFCSVWLGRGDFYALRILAHWLIHQSRGLTRAVVGRRWREVRERSLTLTGTFLGMVHGASMWRSER
jgi:GT2 family glycosyltransferase